jgi:hypothetical protein
MPVNDTIPVRGTNVSKTDVRNNFIAIKAKIDSLPETGYADFAGSVIAVKADGSGPAIPDGPVGFENKSVRRFKIASPDPITESTTFTDEDHGGQTLRCTNGSDIELTLDRDQITNGFTCRVWRRGAGLVTIIFGSGLVNRNADGNSSIATNGMVDIYVDAGGSGDVYFDGRTV